jgi:hypothetical protein
MSDFTVPRSADDLLIFAHELSKGLVQLKEAGERYLGLEHCWAEMLL